jgi:hypothetical protein
MARFGDNASAVGQVIIGRAPRTQKTNKAGTDAAAENLNREEITRSLFPCKMIVGFGRASKCRFMMDHFPVRRQVAHTGVAHTGKELSPESRPPWHLDVLLSWLAEVKPNQSSLRYQSTDPLSLVEALRSSQNFAE